MNTVLFGDDANFSLYMPEYPATRAQLENYVARLAGKVDILAWDCLVNGVCWYPSAVGPNLLQGRDLYHTAAAKLLTENIRALSAAGSPPPQAVAEACHEQGMRMLASIRMGLTLIDEREARAGSGIFLNAHMNDDFHNLTIRNLDYSLEHHTARANNSGRNLDYSFSEVRELILGPCREMAATFPIDGFHLNFIRAGVPFESHEAEGKAAIMTGLIRELRALLDATAEGARAGAAATEATTSHADAGRQGGARRLLAVRVPNDLDFCARLGLDVPTWIAQGLVDIVIPDQVHTMILDARIDAFTRLTAGTGVRVLPSLHPQAQPFGAPPAESRAVFRAAVDNWYRQGAHGFSTFNFEYFHPHDGYTLEWFTEFRQAERVACGERVFPVMAHTLPQEDLYVIQPAGVTFRRHEVGVRKTVSFPRIMALPGDATGAVLRFRVRQWSWEDELAVDIDGRRMEGVSNRYSVHPAFQVLAGPHALESSHLDPRELSQWAFDAYVFTVPLDGLAACATAPAEIGFTLQRRSNIMADVEIEELRVTLMPG